ncbi:hypothetical protein B7P43_G01025, partial [Cryptotermes secundus]
YKSPGRDEILAKLIQAGNYEYNERVHQLFVDFKKACNSVMGEIPYNILIESGVTIDLVRLIKMFLKETYGKVRICKHLSDNFPIQNGPKQVDALSPLFFNFALNMPLGRSRKTRWD